MKLLKIILTFIINLLNPKSKNPTKTPTYYLRPQLLSNAELNFYLVLKTIIPDTLSIFPKIRLIDFIGGNYAARPKLIQKHIDFLICDKNKPILGIELDDSSHKTRADNDAQKNTIFKNANLPLLRFPCTRTYNTHNIAQQITPLLKETQS